MRRFKIITINTILIRLAAAIGLLLQEKQVYLLFRVQSFISYLWHGKSRYHVHSDFVFRYINHVLRNKAKAPVWSQIEQARKQLYDDDRLVAPAALGATQDNQSHSAGFKAKRTGLPPVYGRLLYNTARYFNVNTIIELGTGTGISTMYLAGTGAKQVISLEGNRAILAIAQEQIDKLRMGNVELVGGDFNSTLSTCLGKLGSVDMAFVDGDHQKASTIRYYESILPYTHNDSIIVFDDINWSPDMQAAWQQIIARPEVTLSLDFYRLGMVFFRKEIRQPQHLKLYYW